MDIYFTADETKKAIDDLAIDAVYDSVAAAAGEPGNNNNPTIPVEANNYQSQSLFARRRLIFVLFVLVLWVIVIFISELSYWPARLRLLLLLLSQVL